MDIISGLPNDIKEMILTYLPIKEAGRTSILSTKWRHSWNKIPDLVIPFNLSISQNELVTFVDSILVLHEGPIHKFHLEMEESCDDACDRWIHYLSRNGIRNLILYLDDYQIPSRFFSCSDLTHMWLYGCFLKLPVGFKGFKFLKTLNLMECVLDGDCIEKLVSCCPMLEHFHLSNHREESHETIPNIHAPNLESLYIEGRFMIRKVWAPKLRSMVVTLYEEHSCLINLNQVLSGMPNLECLEMGSNFVNCLVKGHIGDFPFIFQNLKVLRIDLDFEKENYLKFIMSLLQNTPNLQTLHIKMFESLGLEHLHLPIPNFWELIDDQDFSFQRLKSLDIIDCLDCIESALPFIKLVLRSAPNLLRLTIDNYEDSEHAEMCLNQLLSIPRASAKAQIISNIR